MARRAVLAFWSRSPPQPFCASGGSCDSVHPHEQAWVALGGRRGGSRHYRRVYCARHRAPIRAVQQSSSKEDARMTPRSIQTLVVLSLTAGLAQGGCDPDPGRARIASQVTTRLTVLTYNAMLPQTELAASYYQERASGVEFEIITAGSQEELIGAGSCGGVPAAGRGERRVRGPVGCRQRGRRRDGLRLHRVRRRVPESDGHDGRVSPVQNESFANATQEFLPAATSDVLLFSVPFSVPSTQGAE